MDEIYARLRQALVELAAVSGTLSPDAERRLLDRRALRLARAYRAEVVQWTGEVAIFSRSGARYGLDVEDLVAIEPLTALTPVPGVDRAVAGVVHRLGRIHAVLDLAILLGGPASSRAPQGDARWIVFAASGTIAVGLLADELADIVNKKPASRAALGGLPERVLPAVRGVTDDLVTLLDPAGLVTEEIVGARTA
jgi:chemotaxis signal transduction protein